MANGLIVTYEVLARKWRPRQFDDLVGQAHVVRALSHALDQERIHHACLFTGTRGVGKTTVARILARCLNCETGLTSTPCGTCPSCQEILGGRFVDLLEIDAASRTGVDDMRELLDNVQYAPVAGRYKVYLIDEVHMLSANSFNALLKTLEEPPPHVVFILATTDPKKVPVTVLSRCLQFHLRNLLPSEIASQLETVLGGEAIGFESEALGQLARAADGSMRDALSLTDQAISYCDGALSESGVSEMLGSVQRSDVQDVLTAIAAGDGAEVIGLCERLAVKGADFNLGLDELARALHRVMVVQAVGAEVAGEELNGGVISPEVRDQLAGILSPEEVQLYYQIATDGRAQLPNAPEPRVGFEVTLLRMLAFRPVNARELPAGTTGGGGGSGGPTTQGPESGNTAPASGSGAAAEAAPRTAETPAVDASDWYALVKNVPLAGVVRSVLDRCVRRIDGDHQWTLLLDPTFAPLLREEHPGVLADAFSTMLGEPVQIVVEAVASEEETPAQRRERVEGQARAAAREAITSDPEVQRLIEVFDARLLEDSIRPGADNL